MNESQNNSTSTTSLKIIIALLVVIIFLLIALAATYYYFGIKGWKAIEINTPTISNEINNPWTNDKQIIIEKETNQKSFEKKAYEEEKKFEEKRFEEESNWTPNIWLKKNEDLKFTQFLLTTKNLYCSYKSALYNFADISKINRAKSITPDSIDIEKQRNLWKQILKDLEHNGIPEIASGYIETNKEDLYFKELVSLIKGVHENTTNFLESDSQIRNFSDYQNIMLSDFTLAANILKEIPEKLNILYKEFVSVNEISVYYYVNKDDIEASKNVVDIDSLCDIKYN